MLQAQDDGQFPRLLSSLLCFNKHNLSYVDLDERQVIRALMA